MILSLQIAMPEVRKSMKSFPRKLLYVNQNLQRQCSDLLSNRVYIVLLNLSWIYVSVNVIVRKNGN